jgi:hypothetical protein
MSHGGHSVRSFLNYLQNRHRIYHTTIARCSARRKPRIPIIRGGARCTVGYRREDIEALMSRAQIAVQQHDRDLRHRCDQELPQERAEGQYLQLVGYHSQWVVW